MSKEILIPLQSGSTLDLFLRHPTDVKVRDVVAGAWDTWDDADVDDYNIAVTDEGGNLYSADMPSGIASNIIPYPITITLRAGGAEGSVAVTDALVASGTLKWNGTSRAEIKLDASGGAYMATDGLDAVRKTEPSGDPATWTFQDWLNWLTRRSGNKLILILPPGGEGTLVVRNDADDGDLSLQDVDETGTNQLTLGPVE